MTRAHMSTAAQDVWISDLAILSRVIVLLLIYYGMDVGMGTYE